MEVGDRDLFNPNVMRDNMHDWVVANEDMAKVLAAKGYHYQFVFARNAGHVDRAVKQQTLPEALEYVWQGYPVERQRINVPIQSCKGANNSYSQLMTKKFGTQLKATFDNLLPSDPVLQEVLKRNAASGLPAIDVAPNEGKLLYLLAKIRGAKRILEIGTLGGYSTIWLARALPPETETGDPRA